MMVNKDKLILISMEPKCTVVANMNNHTHHIQCNHYRFKMTDSMICLTTLIQWMLLTIDINIEIVYW